MSGAKNRSARASAAMRGPSRQITARLIAGASASRRDRAREIGQHQAFGAVGDLRQRQRPCRLARNSAGEQSLRCLRRALDADGSRAAGGTAACRSRRAPASAHSPRQKICWSGTSSSFRIVELGSLSAASSRVGKAAEHEIHLADAAMPGAEQQPPPPRIQAFARPSRSRSVSNAKNPDGAGWGYIGADVHCHGRALSTLRRGRARPVTGIESEPSPDRSRSPRPARRER